MKTIIIIILASVVGLAIIGGGTGAFVSDLEEGAEKIKENEQFQYIKDQISLKINQTKENCESNLGCIP